MKLYKVWNQKRTSQQHDQNIIHHPILILGQFRCLFGHALSTRDHIIQTGGSLHLVSICSIDLVSPQVLQCLQ